MTPGRCPNEAMDVFSSYATHQGCLVAFETDSDTGGVESNDDEVRAQDLNPDSWQSLPCDRRPRCAHHGHSFAGQVDLDRRMTSLRTRPKVNLWMLHSMPHPFNNRWNGRSAQTTLLSSRSPLSKHQVLWTQRIGQDRGFPPGMSREGTQGYVWHIREDGELMVSGSGRSLASMGCLTDSMLR